MLIMLVLFYKKFKYRNTSLLNVKINQGSKRTFYTWHWSRYKEVCRNLTKINEGENRSRIFKMFMLVIVEIGYLLGTGQTAYCTGPDDYDVDFTANDRTETFSEFMFKLRKETSAEFVNYIGDKIEKKYEAIILAVTLSMQNPEYKFKFILSLVDTIFLMQLKIDEDIPHVFINFKKQEVSHTFTNVNSYKTYLMYQLNDATSIVKELKLSDKDITKLKDRINNSVIDERSYLQLENEITELRRNYSDSQLKSSIWNHYGGFEFRKDQLEKILTNRYEKNSEPYQKHAMYRLNYHVQEFLNAIVNATDHYQCITEKTIDLSRWYYLMLADSRTEKDKMSIKDINSILQYIPESHHKYIIGIIKDSEVILTQYQRISNQDMMNKIHDDIVRLLDENPTRTISEIITNYVNDIVKETRYVYLFNQSIKYNNTHASPKCPDNSPYDNKFSVLDRFKGKGLDISKDVIIKTPEEVRKEMADPNHIDNRFKTNEELEIFSLPSADRNKLNKELLNKMNSNIVEQKSLYESKPGFWERLIACYHTRTFNGLFYNENRFKRSLYPENSFNKIKSPINEKIRDNRLDELVEQDRRLGIYKDPTSLQHEAMVRDRQKAIAEINAHEQANGRDAITVEPLPAYEEYCRQNGRNHIKAKLAYEEAKKTDGLIRKDGKYWRAPTAEEKAALERSKKSK